MTEITHTGIITTIKQGAELRQFQREPNGKYVTVGYGTEGPENDIFTTKENTEDLSFFDNISYNGQVWKGFWNKDDALWYVKEEDLVDAEVSSMDTGGYTGAWGPEGKLALLHEKEIVLNKDDTSNLLQTVGFIHKIVSAINSQAVLSSLFNMSANSSLPAAGDHLTQQTVTIQAEFPNATDHNEIEQAFTNLINTASQYANRK